MGKCNKKIFFYTICIMFIVIGLFFTAIGIFFFKGNNDFPLQPCNKIKIILNLIHKSDTSVAQENTIDAINSSINKGNGVQMDIQQISTGEYIVFHDYNAYETTGVNTEIEFSTYEEIKKLNYLLTIHGTTYNKRREIPILKEALEAICNKRSSASINFHIRSKLSKEFMNGLMNIIDSSSCDCSEDQYFIFETADFYSTNYIREGLANRRCALISQVGVYLHPNTQPLGTYIWLKTKHIISYGFPDSVSCHYSIWKAYPELVEKYKNDGFCISTYGNFEKPLLQYYVDKYRVPDISNASYIDSVVDYESETGKYTILIIIFIIGLLLITVLPIILMLYLCGCICTEKLTLVTEDKVVNI